MVTKPSILLIEPYCPLPITSGGKSRIYETLNFLTQFYSVDLVCFSTSSDEEAKTSAYFKDKVTSIKFFRLNPHKNIFSFLLHLQPYWFSDWYSPALITYLQSQKLSRYQSVIVEMTQLAYLINHFTHPNSVFVAYDVSTVSFYRRFLQAPLIKKPLHLLRLAEIFYSEKRYLGKYNHLIAVTPADKDFLNRLFGLSSLIIPNGIHQITPLLHQVQKTIKLGFIGPINHPPNIDAINFINKSLLLQLDQSKTNYQIYFAIGQLFHPSNAHINYLGHFDNIKDFYDQIDVLIAPLFAGSGSRIKILESLSFGVPVITTAIGAEGLNIDSSYLIIVSTGQEKNANVWLDAIKKIHHQPPTDIKNLTTQLKPFTWDQSFKSFIPLISFQSETSKFHP